MMNNYRLYTFINFYLSPIQQGIQSAHIVSNLFSKYLPPSDSYKILLDWATYDKTIIVCNGGMSEELNENFYLINQLFPTYSNYPFVNFFEADSALGIAGNGIMTGWGIILPESVYAAVFKQPETIGYFDPMHPDKYAPYYEYLNPLENDYIKYYFGTAEYSLLNVIKSKSLAR
jgi:hypothetical protein